MCVCVCVCNERFGIKLKGSTEIKSFFQNVSISQLMYASPLWLGRNAWKKKSSWEWDKNTTCCCEQILEAISYKAISIRPITSYHTNYLSKTSTTLKDTAGKGKSDVLSTRTLGHTRIVWQRKTYLYQLCADTGCRLEDSSRVLVNWVRWWKRVLLARLDDDDDEVFVLMAKQSVNH